MEQVIAAEREWRESGPHPDPPEPKVSQIEHSEGLSADQEAHYRRLLAILSYPLDGESEPSPANLAALTEADRDHLERCATVAAWDRFWRREQSVPHTNRW